MIYILNDSSKNAKVRTIGAYRIATALRRSGYEVEVIDFLSVWSPEEILEYIDAGPKPEWIGISTTFSSNVDHIQGTKRVYGDSITRLGDDEPAFMVELRKRAPVVLGGAPVERLKYFHDADWYVTGYADEAVVALADYISGKSKKLRFKLVQLMTETSEPKKVIRKIINCQELYPVTTVEDIGTEFHETDFIEPDEVLPLEVGRGCIFKCDFCAYPLNGKKKNDYIRPLDQIQQDIETYLNVYKSNKYVILDDTFNDSIDKFRIMSQIYENLDGAYKFWAFGRLDLFGNKEMLELLPRTGWKYLGFGVETFNKAAGSKIGKGLNSEKQKELLAKIKQIAPDTHITLEIIVGLPEESVDSIMETADWFANNPHLWDSHSFKDLQIPDPKYKTWVSELAKNPEKYGYTIHRDRAATNGPYHSLWWDNGHINLGSAIDITVECQDKLDKVHKSYNLVALTTGEFPYPAYEKMQEITTEPTYRYKTRKMNSRGLTPKVKKNFF